MNRRFPLDGLLRARQLAEERAAADLERANAARREADDAIDREERTLARLGFEDVAPVGDGHPGIDDATWRAIIAARASTAVRVGELSAALTEAQARAHEAEREWTVARVGAAMIDKLRVRHDALVAEDALREEQHVLDEAALRRRTEEAP